MYRPGRYRIITLKSGVSFRGYFVGEFENGYGVITDMGTFEIIPFKGVIDMPEVNMTPIEKAQMKYMDWLLFEGYRTGSVTVGEMLSERIRILGEDRLVDSEEVLKRLGKKFERSGYHILDPGNGGEYLLRRVMIHKRVKFSELMKAELSKIELLASGELRERMIQEAIERELLRSGMFRVHENCGSGETRKDFLGYASHTFVIDHVCLTTELGVRSFMEKLDQGLQFERG